MTDETKLNGQVSRFSARELQVLPVPTEIFHVVGEEKHVIQNPDNGNEVLVLRSEFGYFRYRPDENLDVPPGFDPPESVVDGSGSLLIHHRFQLIVQAPRTFSVQGDQETATLTYYWI
jgi:hypothetical protein